MKIKLKDLTIGQLHSICQVACKACPLHCGIGDNIACMTDYPEYDDYEVDIPIEPIEHKFLTAEQVRNFTPAEVRENYKDILLSMPKWG